MRVRLCVVRPESVTVLGQFRRACGNLVQGAARTYNGASEVCNQHPWGTTSHTLAVAFLPASVRNLLGDDGVAHRHDLVSQPTMQTLAVGRQPALSSREASP